MAFFRKARSIVDDTGVTEAPIHETPIAIVDFETTGLVPGADRVVEVSIVRFEPNGDKRMVLDTLVNPMRPMAATEIHGITDEDVRSAPRFRDIGGDVVDALSGAVVASYNVYFDIKFLAFELSQLGIDPVPPHFCLMYMRPMLGLGKRCKLGDACAEHGITYEAAHIAAADAMAASELFAFYLSELTEKGVRTFADLARLRDYKFTNSFHDGRLSGGAFVSLKRGGALVSRYRESMAARPDSARQKLAEYWDALTVAVADFEITDDELRAIAETRGRLGLAAEQIRMLHARVFAAAISEYVGDEWLDKEERLKLSRLHKCLSQLGWAPGE